MWPQEHFWAFTSQSIEDVRRAIASTFRLDCRARNDRHWEAIEGEDRDGRSWRILRRFGTDIIPADEPMRIVVTPAPKEPEEVAHELCDLLGVRIYFGKVRHLYEDGFSFTEEFHVDNGKA